MAIPQLHAHAARRRDGDGHDRQQHRDEIGGPSPPGQRIVPARQSWQVHRSFRNPVPIPARSDRARSLARVTTAVQAKWMAGGGGFVSKRLYFVTLVVMLVGYQMMPGRASSHREAPLISGDPLADNTDVYAFVSPDAPDTVTLIASFVPFEDPAGGPNFYKFGDNVLYEIKIDNNGDGVEDITYQFRYTSVVTNPNTFLYN